MQVRFLFLPVILGVICTLIFHLPAKAGFFNNLLFWNAKKVLKEEAGDIAKDTILKAKAVYLELEGDNVEYDHEKNIYITSGNSVAHIVDQDAKLEADKIIYYGNDQHIEAVGNIKITRNGIVTIGKTFKFDVTSSKYLLTDPETKITGAIIKSRKIESTGEKGLEYSKGEFQLDKPIRIAQGFGTRSKHPRTYYSAEQARESEAIPTWEDIPKNRKYRVSAEKIVYDRTKEIKNLTIYSPRVNFDKFSVPVGPKLTLTVNEDEKVMSAPLLAPNFGTKGALGGFTTGVNLNLNLTKYHILTLTPFGQIGDGGEFAAGGGGGFTGPSTHAELLYGSLKDRFVGEVTQQLFSKKTELHAGWNQYIDGGFLGRTLPQFEIGIVDKRVLNVPFTEGGIHFRSAGNWAKVDPEILPEKFKELQRDAGDPREFKDSAFKAEEQIALVTKPIFKLGTEKFNTALRFRTRNAFRAYSTGDLQGIFTGGPLLDNTFGPLTFELGFDQGAVKGTSPLIYDQFIQGKQSVSLDGDIKLTEWVTLGGYGSYNIGADELVERQFRAKFGPKDFKMLVNWDALRQQTQFGLNFLFGQPVDFEKFVILSSMRRAGSF